jgi:hypothetical protein
MNEDPSGSIKREYDFTSQYYLFQHILGIIYNIFHLYTDGN